MAFQLWLADTLRAAGLTVVEEPGWRTRSGTEDTDASSFSPIGVMIHETRGSATSTAASEIRILINGRVGLSGPISQLFLSRTGVWHIIAAGLCHHVKTGWAGPFDGYGNTRLLGIEAQHAESESWAAKPAQYEAYVRGVAAICTRMGWSAEKAAGHKEHQPGDKPDPEFNMDRFRADVRAVMEGDMTWSKGDAEAAKYRIQSMITMADINPVGANLKPEVNEQARILRRIETGNTKLLDLLAKAIESGGGHLDTAAVLQRIDERAAEDAARDAAAAARIAELEADVARLESELAAVPDAVADELHARTES